MSMHAHHQPGARRTKQQPSSLAPARGRGEQNHSDAFGDGVDLGALQAPLRRASSQGPLQLPTDHPVCLVRDEIRNLYQELEQFVEKHTVRPPSGFGFGARPVEPVRVETLAERCQQTLAALTSVIMRPALDPLTVRVQDIAKDLKIQLQSFRKFLSAPSFKDGVPEPLVEVIVENSMMFQRAISDPMNDTTSLSYGVQVQRQAAGS